MRSRSCASIRRRVVVIVAAVLAGCESPTKPNLSLMAGSYTLVSVGGKPLPAQTTAGLTVTAGSFLLNANGAFQFTEAIAERSPAIDTGDGLCTAITASTMTCQGNAAGAEQFTATLAGSNLTVAVADGARVYTMN